MDFRAGVHWSDTFFISEYTVRLLLVTGTSDIQSQNVALFRMQQMVRREFTDAVFINKDNTKQIKLYRAAGMKVVELPEEPLDQIIGIMLFCKLNAVAEGRLVVLECEVGSDNGDNMFYCHDADEPIGPFAKSGWWNDVSPKITNYKERNSRVVEMANFNTWKSNGLLWPEEEEEEPVHSANVVVVFKKDEPK